jgi:hypothetical protein
MISFVSALMQIQFNQRKSLWLYKNLNESPFDGLKVFFPPLNIQQFLEYYFLHKK